VKSWDEKDSFHASKCWFENAKKRTRIGESASVDHVASTEHLEQFKKIIEERGYLQEKVFNLNWRRGGGGCGGKNASGYILIQE
jgi:xanthine dehydrogenase molybdopterin-binding subunit B